VSRLCPSLYGIPLLVIAQQFDFHRLDGADQPCRSDHARLRPALFVHPIKELAWPLFDGIGQCDFRRW
jgi:hypothetical protein